MAGTDPTDPTATTTATIASPSADDLDAWKQYNTYTAQAADNIQGVNNITHMAQQTFGALNDGLGKLGISFEALDTMTTKQAAGFGALSTTILGSKEAFTSLANVDTSRLLTFTGQIKDMQEILKQSPVYRLLKKELDDVTDAAARMTDKVAGERLVKAAANKLKEFTSVVSDSAMAMLTGADNALRLQNAMYQLTMQAGDSKDLFQGIDGLFGGMSSGFENVGDVMTQFNTVLEQGSAALGGNQELAAKYMAEINRMPGGFRAIIAPLKIGSDQTNILTASIQYAVGAGRKQEDVFSDMSKAMSEYSVSGGDALRFSARMSEVSESLGAQFKDVQSALHGAIDEFKTFVNKGADAQAMTQGMADSMKNYVQELVAVGVPAQNAIEMFKNYSSRIKDMTLGQQAFLSTMSGGGGGLRGALKVQEDIAKGNFDKIRGEVESTIKRLSGPLITREEAMKTEAGSAQYVRQMQILQQGPLGSMAKSQGDADSLIRALKEGGKLPSSGKTPEQSLQDTMTRGQEWQKGSYTELTKVNTNLQAMMLRGGTANLSTTQQMFTAAGARSVPGGSGTGAGISPGSQENLSASQRTINTAAPGSELFKQTAEAVKNLPKTFSDAWKSFQEALGTGNKETIQKANDKMMSAIKDQKAMMATMTEQQRNSLSTLQQNFSGVKPETQQAGSGGPKGTPQTTPTTSPLATGLPKMTFTPVQNYARPGQRIPAPLPPSSTAANNGITGTGTAQQGGPNQGAPGQVTPVAVTVNITGVCPHCGADINHSPTDSGVSQGTNQRK